MHKSKKECLSCFKPATKEIIPLFPVCNECFEKFEDRRKKLLEREVRPVTGSGSE